jgi:hypothetical protein
MDKMWVGLERPYVWGFVVTGGDAVAVEDNV